VTALKTETSTKNMSKSAHPTLTNDASSPLGFAETRRPETLSGHTAKMGTVNRLGDKFYELFARAARKPVDVLSCPDAIAQASLRTMNGGGEKTLITSSSEICPRRQGPREPGRCGVCLSCSEGGCDGW
jgi:hypothetical protein